MKKYSEIELFSDTAIELRKLLPNHNIEIEGGGAAALCISIDVQHPDRTIGNDGKMQMWFGTANELWMADCYINPETAEHFDFDTNTCISSDCTDAELIATGIAKVVRRFESQPVLDKWTKANAEHQLEMMPKMLQAAREFVEAARALSEAWEPDYEGIGTAHATEAFTRSFDENVLAYQEWLTALEKEIVDVTKKMNQKLGRG